VTTKTVLNNLIFGCLLVFLIQWIFLGDLRSAIIVGINIPFALFFSVIILVLRGEEQPSGTGPSLFRLSTLLVICPPSEMVMGTVRLLGQFFFVEGLGTIEEILQRVRL
jgi:hypothetical protein